MGRGVVCIGIMIFAVVDVGDEISTESWKIGDKFHEGLIVVQAGHQVDAVTDEKIATCSIACWGTGDDLAESRKLVGGAEPFQSVLLGHRILEEDVTHGTAAFDLEGVDLVLLRRDVDQRMR